ncbi:restriction endonuclease subunit S [uncultured Anaerococcus sp.]|uniref:restriction endonuclease subunit S n=1 Tax=uncultured Anaerococcus sp. TaxID=293428 RepID=UPI00280A63D3|nr:restriction endonuclease subunit S [uncultured Anaerococcus sp.]MDU5149466.1 restriction endonuclease subunit S [Anaerococcus prevotii]
MRKVPELRFAGFDGEWEEGTLSDLGSVSMNKRIYKDETSEIGDVPFYKIGTFGSKADSYISRDLFEEYKSKYPYPKVGDLLISASGSIGKVIEYKGEDAYYQDSNIVWLDVNDKVKNSFLKQFYETVNWNELEGSTIKRLYNKDLLRKKIAYPKLSEQEKIGDLFKKIDDLIEIQEGKLSRMEDFKKSMLQKMFPKKDELVPEFRFDGFYGEWSPMFLKDLVYSEYKGKAMADKLILGGSTEYLDTERLNGGAPVLVDNDPDTNFDDILILWDGSKAGAIYTKFEGILGSTLRGFKINDDNDSYFIYSFLKMNENLIENRYRTPNIPHVVKDFSKVFEIKVTSFKEQQKIGHFFKTLDTQIENEEKLLDSYKIMKKSLLQKMFV